MRGVVVSGGRVLAAVLSVLLIAPVWVGAGAGSAVADTVPPDPGTPATVSADALPTVQVDGVVWTQTVIGNTVYAGGRFTTARPAGAAPGVSTTPRGNLLAYDIRTGALVTSFAPVLNGQVLGLAGSPDGSRLYVAGEFTTANGVNRYRVAAFNTATGALITTFAPQLDFRARALAVTNTTVYVGGAFNTANGNARTRLAAFQASNGALLPWAPAANAQVLAMVMAPDQSKVIVGGQFTQISGNDAYGMGALDPVTGAVLPWAANQVVRDAQTQGAIYSLSTDGTKIYGTGYSYNLAEANMEGNFAADPATGNIVWIADCHGDHYSNFPVNGVVYTVGHAHYCGNIGGFPQTNPWTFNHALALSAEPTGIVKPDPMGYPSFAGQPAPSLLTWFPRFEIGNVTGQNQAAWNVSGNKDYVVMGGEFPRVNGVAQQGLVRFATRALAPNQQTPVLKGATFLPSVASLTTGTVRVAWQANWDRDNELLTYKLIRNSNAAAPVFETTARSTFWDRPTMGFTDRNLVPGQRYTYRLSVTDGTGNTVLGDNVAVTVASSGSLSTYAQTVLDDGAATYWRLNESSGNTAFDWVGFNDGLLGTDVTRGAGGAIIGDGNTATSFNGTDAAQSATRTSQPGPDNYTLEAWVKTTSTSGGKIIGFGDNPSGNSGAYDRHIYMTNSGRIVYGVYNNGFHAVGGPTAYNDGEWHHVVATLGSGGMVLYVDAKRVGRDSGTTAGHPYSGYWRLGGDNLNGWPDQPSSFNFQGAVDEVAIYDSALTSTQVGKHYTDSGRSLTTGVRPADVYGGTIFDASPDFYWRMGEASGSVAEDTTANDVDGMYTGGTSLGSTGGVAGTSNTAVTLDGTNGLVSSVLGMPAPNGYSEELWFKTTTTSGGKLIGFGSEQIAGSGSYDRHVYMFDDGRLRFGAYQDGLHMIDTPESYNDGDWHYLVATQGAAGMKLYVDGLLVGTDPQPTAVNYAGYWRVGGDTTWGGNSSNYFAGTVDEVAIYSSVLSGSDVADHFVKGGGSLPNVAPTAEFTSEIEHLDVDFDASESADSDGTVDSYAWDFGDGDLGSGKTPSHHYALAGDYSVTLVVTDNDGDTGSMSHQVTVTAPPPNVAPNAEFSSEIEFLDVDFDASGSADSDGTVDSYAWDFGDGDLGSGKTPSHHYALAGDYSVTLVVTDNDGDTGSMSHQVTVAAPPPNAAPTAAFTSDVDNLAVDFDGSGSADSDGTVDSYAWDFGDGDSGVGVTPSHTYDLAGEYTVTLVVTDNDGDTGTVSHPVTATVPPVFAADVFARTVSGGWGSADTGGAWTLTGGAANFSVGAGVGQMRMNSAGATSAASLNGVSSADTEVRVSVALDKAQTGGGTYVSVLGRKLGTAGDYRFRLRYLVGGGVTASLSRTVSGTETALTQVTVPGLTYALGEVLQLRVQVSGTSPTTLRAKVWRQGQTEPAAWLVTTTDSTPALQAAGAVGLLGYLSGTSTNAPLVARFDDFWAGPRP